MFFQDLEGYKNNNNQFGKLLTYLGENYSLLIENVSITDFFIKEGFHSITIKNDENFLNIELHKNRIELKVNFILFCMFFEDFSDVIIYKLLASAFKGEYKIIEYFSEKGALRKRKIIWDSSMLNSLNREENISLKSNYQSKQINKFPSLILEV